MSTRREQKLNQERFPAIDSEWDYLTTRLVAVTAQRDKLYVALQRLQEHVLLLEHARNKRLQGGGDMTEWDMCARAVGDIVDRSPLDRSALHMIHSVLEKIGDPDGTKALVESHLDEEGVLRDRVSNLEWTNSELRTENARLRRILSRR